MSNPSPPPVLAICAWSRPWLPRHIKIRHDTSRGRTVVLAPEKVFSPNPVAVDVLKLCDGIRTVDDIASVLSSRYNAPAGVILADITGMLTDLQNKGVVRL